MIKEKIEELVKKFGLREVVRVNNRIANNESNFDNVVYFAEEFDKFCEGVTPTQIAQFVSNGTDMKMGDFFSFEDCIIFYVDWLGYLQLATTKEGVYELLTQTLEFVGYEEFLQLVNKDYIEKF